MARSIVAFSFALVASLASGIFFAVQAQTNSGFISIDCGATNEYTDDDTGITYKTDEEFIDSGENMQISTEFIYQDNRQLAKNLRRFPNGTRNCYRIKPDQGKNNAYLIRARFWYGNYDGNNQTPSFDLHIDVNYWTTVDDADDTWKDIMYVSQTDDIQVCLVNTGMGVPFISALELRTLDDDIYRSGSGFLRLDERQDIGGNSSIRYPDDVYDRIWTTEDYPHGIFLNTISTIGSSDDNDAYKVPSKILQTAQRAINANTSLYLEWTPSSSAEKWILYFYFVEIERLTSNLQREFTVSMNDNQFTKTVSLEYLKPVVVVSTPVSGSRITFSIDSTNKSGYPPILNAVEYYTVGDFQNIPTAPDDVNAMYDVKKTYGGIRDSWQGDPCLPTQYSWSGVNCSYCSHDNSTRIVSLNLSSSGLKGLIATSISNLTAVVSLDLSYNSLTGPVPDFLAQMPSLKVLNLSGNSLNGSVPHILLKKKAEGSLLLSLGGNPNLCKSHKCQTSNVRPIIASVAAVLVLTLLGALVVLWIIKRRQTQNVTTANTTTGGSTRTLRLKDRPFTSTEVIRITDNFQTVIGEGGFGKVYLGRLDDGTQVAVKMLSRSSKQGCKEFHAEAQLLMVVHHRNLVSLVGYCEEFESMALIYELMSNGNVRQRLSAHNPNVLSWSQRLQIAVDAAQGLEYLHNGCKHPIIHRDLKTANILLNIKMQAKIADFGLSIAFETEHDSHISTVPAGTRGYLDPEYHVTGNLSKKSDVYSFGIVLFELITGLPAIIRSPEESKHILHWVTPLIQRRDIQSIVDPRLNGEFDVGSAWKLVEITLSCVQTTAVQRPDMNHVLSDLKECLTAEIGSGRSQRPDMNHVLSNLKECLTAEVGPGRSQRVGNSKRNDSVEMTSSELLAR